VAAAPAPPAVADPTQPASGASPGAADPGDSDPGGRTPGDDRSADLADEAGSDEAAPTEDGAESDPPEAGTDEPTRRGAEDRASGALVVADRDGPDRGAPVATAAGIGLVAALGGAAAWQARRRTRPGPGEDLS
jgi:hypothetical protein